MSKAKETAAATFKIGGDEVRFEGSREAVEAQLEKFINRLLDRGAAVAVSVEGPEVAPAPAPEVKPPASEVKPPASEAKPPLTDAQLFERLYGVTADGRLTMSRTPKAPGDVLLLVLYGMVRLQESPWVSAPMLVRTAREAGARFDRADRLLAKRPTLIEGNGMARGRRYRLTPKGVEHCRRLVRDLVAHP